MNEKVVIRETFSSFFSPYTKLNQHMKCWVANQLESIKEKVVIQETIFLTLQSEAATCHLWNIEAQYF